MLLLAATTLSDPEYLDGDGRSINSSAVSRRCVISVQDRSIEVGAVSRGR